MGFWHSGDLEWFHDIDNIFKYAENFFLTKEEINEIWK